MNEDAQHSNLVAPIRPLTYARHRKQIASVEAVDDCNFARCVSAKWMVMASPAFSVRMRSSSMGRLGTCSLDKQLGQQNLCD